MFVHVETRRRACRTRKAISKVQMPQAVMGRAITAPDPRAQGLAANYVDQLALCRKAVIYVRSDIAVSRATLAERIHACEMALRPLVDQLHTARLAQPVSRVPEAVVGNELQPDTDVDVLATPGTDGREPPAWVTSARDRLPTTADCRLATLLSLRDGA